MAKTTASSSGHIIEFNLDTGIGLIEETATKRILSIGFKSFKKNSKKYLKNDHGFIGELFDFDVRVQQTSNEDDAGAFEAINVRHRVLKCNFEGCPRLKAFTNMKALEDHIHIRHTSKKQTEQTSSPHLIFAKKSKKKRPPTSKPITINLSFHTAPETIGRFIGKQGVNLKRFQQSHHVTLRLLNSRNTTKTLQIRIKSNAGVVVDLQSVGMKLKAEWERCIREQDVHEKSDQERFKYKPPFSQPMVEFKSDPRYRDDLKFRIKRFKQQARLGRRVCRQMESLVRFQERRSSFKEEDHGSTAECDSEWRQKSFFNCYYPKKISRSVSEEQWSADETSEDLEGLSVSS